MSMENPPQNKPVSENIIEEPSELMHEKNNVWTERVKTAGKAALAGLTFMATEKAAATPGNDTTLNTSHTIEMKATQQSSKLPENTVSFSSGLTNGLEKNNYKMDTIKLEESDNEETLAITLHKSDGSFCKDFAEVMQGAHAIDSSLKFVTYKETKGLVQKHVNDLKGLEVIALGDNITGTPIAINAEPEPGTKYGTIVVERNGNIIDNAGTNELNDNGSIVFLVKVPKTSSNLESVAKN